MTGTYLLIQIAGSAMLLLWSIRMARTSVMRAYGTNIRIFLPQKLGNRLVALVTGVAVFLASLAAQGVVPLTAGLAVMLGADVGSAMVVLLLSLNLRELWPVFITAGYLLHSLSDETRLKQRQYGRFLLGLGIVLIALTFMGQVSGALAASPTIATVIAALAGEPILAALGLAVLTWLTHSSMAVLLLVASLSTTGVLTDPELIVACVLGINLGGGLPAIVMTLRQPVAARRILWGNGLFRLVAVVAGLVLLRPLTALSGRLPGDAGMRVVLFHILFNLALAAVFLPFLGRIAGWLRRLLPDDAEGGEEFGPRYIAPAAGAFPAALPLSALTRETLRMGDVVLEMLVATATMLQSRQSDAAKVREVQALDDRVDVLYKAIRSYAIDLTRTDDLPASGMRRINGLFRYAVALENAGDLVEKSLLDTIAQKNRSRIRFSEAGDAELSQLYTFVVDTMQLSAEVVMSWDATTAAALQRRDGEFEHMVNHSSECHMERLRRGVTDSEETSAYHLDIINDLRRINTIVSSVAGDVIAAAREDGAERSVTDPGNSGARTEPGSP